jgi:pyridoxal phosphate enzyme (YggS family)
MTVSLMGRAEAVIERVAAAAERAGRGRGDVKIVAVSKTFPLDAIRDAVEAGIRVFGENRAQEFAQKAASLDRDVEWHFVGHLQTNKVRLIVGLAALIHSVDRPGLAEAISRRAEQIGVIQRVLIEVNVSGEVSKHGIEPARAEHLVAEAQGLPGIEAAGLMTIAPFSADPEDARPYFRELRELRDSIALQHPGVVELSMGMSGDLEVGVEEGATIVRVGRAIFGDRTG